MIALTWNGLLMFMLIGFVVGGIVMRRAQASVLLVATYIALAVTKEIGLSLFRFVRQSGFGTNTSQFMIMAIVFIILTFLLFVEGEYIASAASPEGTTGSVYGGIFGALAGCIVITTLAHFMGADDRAILLRRSSIADLLYPLRVWLLIPFPLYLCLMSLLKRFK
jgi:uncharacterized membrane protein required for colicin V production